MSPEALLSLFLAEARTQSAWVWSSEDGAELAATQLVSAASPSVRAQTLLLAAEALAVPEEGGARYDSAWSPALGFLVEHLLGLATPLDAPQLARLVALSARWPAWDWLDTPPYDAVLQQVEEVLDGQTPGAALSDALRALRVRLAVEGAWDAPQQARFSRLDRVLSPRGAAPGSGLDGSDAWAAAVETWLGSAPPDRAAAWRALLTHCGTARRSSPTKRWRARGMALLQDVGAEPFEAALGVWLPTVPVGLTRAQADERDTLRVRYRTPADARPGDAPPRALGETNRRVVRGLLWVAGGVGTASMADRLEQAAERFHARIEGVGAADAMLGHAAIVALSGQPADLAVPRLNRLRHRVEHRRAVAAIDAALARISPP